MKKEDFNSEWQFVKGYVPSLKVLAMYGKQAQKITLPHDAMIHEARDENTKNGGATGFYPGGVYTYFKTFPVSQEWEEKTVILEFAVKKYKKKNALSVHTSVRVTFSVTFDFDL